MKKLTVLMMVLAAGAVRADPRVSLVPSADFNLRLAEADRRLEAIEGRQRSASVLWRVGAAGMAISGITMLVGFGALATAMGGGNGDGHAYDTPAALLITAGVTLVVGVACFIAAGNVIPSVEEEAAVKVERDVLHIAASYWDDFAASADVAPAAADVAPAPRSAPPVPVP